MVERAGLTMALKVSGNLEDTDFMKVVQLMCVHMGSGRLVVSEACGLLWDLSEQTLLLDCPLRTAALEFSGNDG